MSTQQDNFNYTTIFILIVPVCIAIIFMIVFIFPDNSPYNGYDFNDEIYCKDIDSENIKYNGEILYLNNQLSLISTSDATKPDIEELAGEYHAQIVGYIEFTGDYQLEFYDDKSYDELNSIAKELEQSDYVKSSSICNVIKLNSDSENADSEDSTNEGFINTDGGTTSFYPNDPWGENTKWDKINPGETNWNVEAIHATEAWAHQDDMNYVNIGVLEPGNFSDTNDDLIFTRTWNSNQNMNTTHSTHVSGIIGATFNNEIGITGICPYTFLFGSSISSPENYTTLLKIKCGLARLILNDVKVINCSFGCNDFLIASSLNINSQALKIDSESFTNGLVDFLRIFYNNGYDFLIVKAAGNANEYYYKKVEPSKEFHYGIEYCSKKDYKNLPKDIQREFTRCKNIDTKYDLFSNITQTDLKSKILVVGSCKQSKNSYTFTNKSSCHGDRVDVLAPGKNIYSTYPNNEYKELSGTSMAAPHVTGVAGMIWGIDENLKASQVANIIKNTANIKANNKKKVVTANMINARFAVDMARKVNSQDLNNENSDSNNNTENRGVFLFSVYDTDNNHLSRVNVKFTNKQTNNVITSLTDGNGEVTQSVESGVYDIEFVCDGYKTKKLSNIIIENKSKVDQKIVLPLNIQNKETTIDSSYIGKWGYTKEIWHGGTRPTTYSWEINIKSIDRDNITFDYIDYVYTGESLGHKGNNITATVSNDTVTFSCPYGNVGYDIFNGEDTISFYIKNGEIIVDNQYLVKGGKQVIIQE